MSTAGPPRNPDDAVRAWHDALAAGDRAAETAAWLDSRLLGKNLQFGGRPLCTVLRPRFLTREQWVMLRSGCRLLLRAFGSAYRAARQDPVVMEQFRLAPWEREVVEAEPDTGPPNPLVRLDAFYTDDGSSFRLTELNGETPAGPAYVDQLSNLFLSLPIAREFLRDWAMWPLPARHHVLHALLAAWERHAGRGRAPTIGIIDWADVPTWSEFELFREYFTGEGLDCVLAHPGELALQNGRLFASGMPIDIVYKRVLLHELVAREGVDHPLLRAVRAGAVVMVNGLRCKVLHKKASLAVLSDERNAALFGDAERQAIDRHIPWTRVVEERRTTRHGQQVDLVPHILAQREQMVLKPNDDYGGHGIVLGWETDATAWESAVRAALEAPFVVQERISLPKVPFPSMERGTLTLADRVVDTAPFGFNGVSVDGCLTRISTDSLVNVTAGGGSTVATFVVERRLP